MQGAGKGLFAIRTKTKGLTPTQLREPIFKAKEKIASYTGEQVTKGVLDDRYGNYTAPYTLQVGEGSNVRLVDAACERGIAAFANAKPPSRANAKLTKTGNLIATKNIHDGVEIFTPYHADARKRGADDTAYKFHKNVDMSTR